MADTARTLIDNDVLSGLEERILRAVDTIARLREEKRAADARMRELSSGQSSASETLKAENARLRAELDALREERRQTRSRIERLLNIVRHQQHCAVSAWQNILQPAVQIADRGVDVARRQASGTSAGRFCSRTWPRATRRPSTPAISTIHSC